MTAPNLTREALTRIVTATRDELGELMDEHERLRLTLHGARALLSAALVAARRQPEIVARGTLLGTARQVGATIADALRRHPELAVPDTRLCDAGAWLAALERTDP